MNKVYLSLLGDTNMRKASLHESVIGSQIEFIMQSNQFHQRQGSLKINKKSFFHLSFTWRKSLI